MNTMIRDASPSTSGLQDVSELAGRLFLVALFAMSGFGKATAYDATAGYMASMGVAAWLLPLVILLEVGGSVAIIAGWKTRVFAFLLAGFSLVSALVFHANFADQIQSIMFMKNVAIAGGFLLLVAHGAGKLSVDARSK